MLDAAQKLRGIDSFAMLLHGYDLLTPALACWIIVAMALWLVAGVSPAD